MLLSEINISIITFKKTFYKNIVAKEEYINNYCSPNQTSFANKGIMWYLYNKARDVREYEVI